MVVSSLVVRTLPEQANTIRKKLGAIDGVEVNDIIDGYKIIVVMEADRVEDEITISKQISQMDGVLAVNLAYHHFEDMER
jgi:nitrate reductase NapD